MQQVLQRTVGLLVLALVAASIARELAQPRWLRTGQGRVLGLPYRWRLPAIAELRTEYWNAEGAALAPPLLGVGFGLNLPALWRRVTR